MRELFKGAALLGALWVYRPTRDLIRRLRRRHPVRIFTFHRVRSEFQDGMTVAPDVFRAQLAYIARFHRIVSLDEALSVLRSGQSPVSALAVLTFDDGYRCVYDTARPIMDEAGVVGTAFITTDLVDTDRRFAHDADSPFRDTLSVMTWRQLSELAAQGWTIGAHTATHPNLARCDRTVLDRELRDPLRVLRERFGVSAPAFAYPFGGPDDITPEGIRIAQEAGYSVCLRDFDGENFPSGEFVLGRTELGGNHATLAWRARVHGIDFSRLGHRWRA
jgi:peptidoglycan/xylan/chitin deacetylase (PgdA/CDA1 family)